MSTMEALATGLCVIGTSFAIPDEIKDFEFCCRHNFEDISKTVEEIIKLYETWHNKKPEISSKTISNFGKKQYVEKIINYTNKVLSE